MSAESPELHRGQDLSGNALSEQVILCWLLKFHMNASFLLYCWPHRLEVKDIPFRDCRYVPKCDMITAPLYPVHMGANVLPMLGRPSRSPAFTGPVCACRAQLPEWVIKVQWHVPGICFLL